MPAEDSHEEERVVIRDKRRIDPQTGQVRATASATSSVTVTSAASAATVEPPDATDVTELEQQLGERTEDLQRLQAQFVNFKRRSERDMAAAGSLATASVMMSLLPLLDDIERARTHGDLTGAFRAVAEGLERVTSNAGLESFGEPGDPFDPTIHEAVTHAISADVDEVQCALVLRRGYRLGDRLIRAAMVGVVEPGEPELVPEDVSGQAAVSSPEIDTDQA